MIASSAGLCYHVSALSTRAKKGGPPQGAVPFHPGIICLHSLDVIVGHITGPAGLGVLHLAPGLPHRDHDQGVAGHQAADRGRLLGRLRPQSHALVGIPAAGLGGHGVGVHRLE